MRADDLQCLLVCGDTYSFTMYVARCAKISCAQAYFSGTSDHLAPHLAPSSGEASLIYAKNMSPMFCWLLSVCTSSSRLRRPSGLSIATPDGVGFFVDGQASHQIPRILG